MYNPIATYRLQFHQEFNFADFEKRISYLQKLGVSTIYASPVFTSTQGSTHGYDGVDPNQIDPEIGDVAQLKKISERLKGDNMGWIQDIVPNHMAFHPENPWLMDVLEKGRQSVYAAFFDIAWNSRLFHGKLMVPFLETELDELLQQEKIVLDYVPNRFCLKYEDAAYPLHTDSYLIILNETVTEKHQSLAQITDQIREITGIEDPILFSARWNELLLQLASLMKHEEVKAVIEARLHELSVDQESLRLILDQQTYVLCNWKNTEHHINFRRFFTVNGLICLNIQNEEVFNQYHYLTKTLIDQGVFQGLRIDHIDGLYDPEAYLAHLRQLAGSETYVVVEKILGATEQLPEKWPVQGTTGYEFMTWVNSLLTNRTSEASFTAFYEELTGSKQSVKDQLLAKKSMILYDHMAGELENLSQLFTELNLIEPELLDQVGRENVKKLIGAFLIHCPVYRFYGKEMPLDDEACEAIMTVFGEIEKYNPDLTDVMNLVKSAMLTWSGEANEEYNERLSEFYQRCMQFTGPLMAKGGEDTLMYTYQRFIGHNEVGDSPENDGMAVEDFHARMIDRQQKWPLSLNATSTHDTKRGEDVRARLNVLTDLADDWLEQVRQWQDMNKALREKFGAPDVNDEYLIYQMLLGAYPMAGSDDDDFEKRFEAYLQKALREAGTNSTWSVPNEAYEAGVWNFAKALLDKTEPFWATFEAFHSQVSGYGIINSLVQTVLKFGCPGTPDVYQGCELWDLSMVDPDNRRPVDYEKRQSLLAEMDQYDDPDRLLEHLWENKTNGQIKLWLTRQLFQLRKQNSDLFAGGDYLPLKVQGALKEHVLAFARVSKKSVIVIAVALNVAAIRKKQGTDFLGLDWKDTKIALPSGFQDFWENLLTNDDENNAGSLSAGKLFGKFPAAIFRGQKVDNERNAGVLVHISSLPSPFGIGDLGPEAFAFADFLHRSKQKIWQILPLNPTEEAQGNSPYSALSSRAGNPLLISPELLAKDGFLDGETLSEYFLPQSERVDFAQTSEMKLALLDEAYTVFKETTGTTENIDFKQFCKENKDWLDDFALYMVLRKKFDNRPWIEWEEPFRFRDAGALRSLSDDAADEIQFVKWVQYVFDKQWKILKKYCNDLDISLLGDIPFYVSYNSSDVWARPDLFMLDKQGQITGIAGVPPDSFSEDGQLWGMPVFAWEIHKAEGYQWWIARLRKNTELFDLVRLDHFRAFADHWVVPGGEKTAVNGAWEQGPNSEFFKAIEAGLGSLPFVAEDLGEPSPGVYALRDEFQLPGMKVLQFAFEDNMPKSDHIVHNYAPNFIAYTGTHDNNTIRGWFREELDEEGRKKFEEYAGRPVDETDVYEIAARLIYSSVAKTAILPIQDVLNLDESAKMNRPGSGDGNWEWRLLPGQLSGEVEGLLQQWTRIYNRE